MTKYTITSLILVGTNIFVWRVPPLNLPPPSCFHCQNIPLSNNFHHNIFGYQIIQPMWIWTLSWFHWVWAESSDCYYDVPHSFCYYWPLSGSSHDMIVPRQIVMSGCWPGHYFVSDYFFVCTRNMSHVIVILGDKCLFLYLKENTASWIM